MVASDDGVMGGVCEKGSGGVWGVEGCSRLRRERRWSVVSDWSFSAYRFWVRVLRTRSGIGEKVSLWVLSWDYLGIGWDRIGVARILCFWTSHFLPSSSNLKFPLFRLDS